MNNEALVEKTVASVKEANELKAEQGVKSRRRRRVVAVDPRYGLLFGKSLEIRETFSTRDAALAYVKDLPVARAAGVRLVTIQDLVVEVNISVKPVIVTRESQAVDCVASRGV